MFHCKSHVQLFYFSLQQEAESADEEDDNQRHYQGLYLVVMYYLCEFASKLLEELGLPATYTGVWNNPSRNMHWIPYTNCKFVLSSPGHVFT